METVHSDDCSQQSRPQPTGFTLLEMMTVMLLILITASISVPAYQTVRVRAREVGRVPGFGCQVSGTGQTTERAGHSPANAADSPRGVRATLNSLKGTPYRD